jgi:hypothetical protein
MCLSPAWRLATIFPHGHVSQNSGTPSLINYNTFKFTDFIGTSLVETPYLMSFD